jgi:hypothetical protein
MKIKIHLGLGLRREKSNSIPKCKAKYIWLLVRITLENYTNSSARFMKMVCALRAFLYTTNAMLSWV